jgi:hypothetical protein
MRPVREKTEQLLVWTAALAFVQMLVLVARLRAQQRTWQETRGLRAPHGVFFLFHAAAGTAPSATAASQGFHHGFKPRSRAMTPALM